MAGGFGAEGVQEVLRHLLDLVDAHIVLGMLVAEPDLGEPDRVRAAEQLAPRVADVGDLDLEVREPALPERDGLPRGRSRRRVERDRQLRVAVEDQLNFRDPAIAAAVQRLDEVHVVGGDGRRELQADVLPDGIAERRRPPRRGQVAVEGASGAILRCVRDGVAVLRGLDRLDAALLGRGLGVGGLAGKRGQARVVRVGDERLLPGLLGVSDVVEH